MQRLGVASGAARDEGPATQAAGQSLGDLRAAAVASAEEEDLDVDRAGLALCTWRRGREAQTGMQFAAARNEEVAAAGEVEGVVGVAPIRAALPPVHHSGCPQLRQVVGDEVLRSI